MPSVWRNLIILTWKCSILRRRKWITTILEFLVPIGIFFLLQQILKFLISTTESQDKQDIYGPLQSAVSPEGLASSAMIGYTPNDEISNSIFKNTQSQNLILASFQTEKEVNKWMKSFILNPTSPVPTGVIFLENDIENKNFKYKIKVYNPPMTINVEPSYINILLSQAIADFSIIQAFLDTQILRISGMNEVYNIQVGHLTFKLKSASQVVVKLSLFLFVFFAYILCAVSVVRDVIAEKECGIKELMKVLGVSTSMIWAHWLIYMLMVQVPVAIGCSVIMNMVLKCGILILFMLFLLFIINVTFILFSVTCLFYRTSRALSIVIICWFILGFVIMKFLLNYPENTNFLIQLLLCLVPFINLCWALNLLYSFRVDGLEWTFDKMFLQGLSGSQMSIGFSIIMFIMSTLLFGFVLVYLDAIFPGPYGVAKPFTFICQGLIKCFAAKETPEDIELANISGENFEPPGENAKVGIKLRRLHKKYGFFNQVTAVENVNLDIYEGEIMALLGHNGAGKTTTMSMITGMTCPTRGVIMFQGHDVTFNKKLFRESLGFCPQHDLFFPNLTVIEHLIFFGVLKGKSYNESKREAKNILLRLNILEKKNTMGFKLSGGMKRRLCLAISLTGNPKVLILDEPTSGLDPQNRRLLWDIILETRGERTVLITTHLMEEADVLGDRIAIMDHGNVVCCGTSMFLKRLYGTGYQVHVLMQPGTSVKIIQNVVKQNVPNAKLKIISDSQVDFIIKEDQVENMPGMFSALENGRDSLNITGFTVSSAALEDVFLKVALKTDGESHSNLVNDSKTISNAIYWDESEKVNGFSLILERLCALFYKRFLYRKRHLISFLIKVILFVLIIVFFARVTKIQTTDYESQKPLLIELSLYPEKTVLIYYDEISKKMGNEATNFIASRSGHYKIFDSDSELKKFLENKMEKDIYYYMTKLLFVLTFEKNIISVRYLPFVNIHASSIAINLVTNVILKTFTDGIGEVQVINHPYTKRGEEKCDTSNSQMAPVMWMCIFACGLIYLLSEFITFITEERVTGFKHQQYMAGAFPILYWFVNFTFDFSVYLLIVIIYFLTFIVFGPTITLLNFTWWLTLVFLLQGLSGLSFTYLYTYFINDLGTSLSMYLVINLVFGVFPAILLSIDELVYMVFPGSKFYWYLLIISILHLNPIFGTCICLKRIINVIMIEETCRICGEECPVNISSFLKFPTTTDVSGILMSLFFFVFTFILYFLIVFLIDLDIWKKVINIFKNTDPDYSVPPDTDKDVEVEIKKVKDSPDESDETLLKVASLEKKYLCGPKAVDKVSFLVAKGESFGLLGVNGAGKSTTFKMLTAEILLDRGNAFVNGFSVRSDKKDYMSCVGYCPQSDPILPSLTGKETLTTIARLRGIPLSGAKSFVELWLNAMDIKEHGDKGCGTYSGGTKRKLCMAMAMIGGPEVVFLDEPTTGVDPASRRKLWTVIQELQKYGQSVVLTSHSMDECEVLCSKLTIMVGGRMRCIGSVQYLKNKFGRGFTVLLKLVNPNLEAVNNLKKRFNRSFPRNIIKDEHAILIHYQVLDPNIPLSRLFSDMIQIKREHDIVEDFTVTNMTLEDLFLTFAETKQK